MKIKSLNLRVFISYCFFIIIILILAMLFSEPLKIHEVYFNYIIAYPIICMVSVLQILRLNSKFKQLTHYFAHKFIKMAISLLSTLYYLNSNTDTLPNVLFFVLIIYLLNLTFEIILLITNLRAVSNHQV